MTLPLDERFWDKVDASGDCWLWMGYRMKLGYGAMERKHLGRGPTLAHRYAWMQLVGPIEPGLQLDHLCRNPPCVNPDHLEPVTWRENIRRGFRKTPRKTHCIRGHELTPETVYVSKRGARNCRECARQNQQRYAARRGAST